MAGMSVVSREVDELQRLLGSLAVYRLAFGQPRQDDLVEYRGGGGAQAAVPRERNSRVRWNLWKEFLGERNGESCGKPEDH